MDPIADVRLLMLIFEAQLRIQEEDDNLLRLQLQLLQVQIELNEMNARTPRSIWVKRWVSRRKDTEPLMSLFRELTVEDPKDLRSFIRMDYDTFLQLVRRVGPRIVKQRTNWREPISVTERLLLTLTYLTEGGIYRTKKFLRRTPHNTMSKIIKEVCEAIYEEYEEQYLTCPTTSAEWKRIAHRFQEKWQFPHTLGALDGKHVKIQCPAKSGSTYYNYKGFYSIVLMALVDAEYKFIWVEVGGNGASSDAQIFNDCDLQECLLDGTLNIPADEPLPGDDRDIPYYLVGDDAFGIQTWLMKPFGQRGLSRPQRIFNYRISRARRIVENAFGILANRFGILTTTMRQTPETAATIVKACIVLHNLLRSNRPLQPGVVDEENPGNHNIRPGYWRRFQQMHDIEELTRGNAGTRRARQQRQYLAHYVCSAVGSVPWQDAYIEAHP